MLLLCYAFPPLAVLLMGKPFSAVLNLFLTAFLFWIPGIKHALVCYADWKVSKHVDRMVGAVNNPAYVKKGGGVANVTHNHYHSSNNNPRAGQNGYVHPRRS
jgi:uncharacterized membrane protein YqaE (UPF0057 family)